MTDLKKFTEYMEKALKIFKAYFILSQDNIKHSQGYNQFIYFMDEMKILFRKHYSISEDEILKLAAGIKLKRESKENMKNYERYSKLQK